MNRDKFIVGLLLASWTLNVALIVAYFFRTTYPTGATWLDGPPEFVGHAPPPHAPPGFRFDAHFRGRAREMFKSRHTIMTELAEVYAANELDTARVIALGDSIKFVRESLLDGLIEQMIESHGQLSVEERKALIHRFIRQVDRKSGPMPPPRGGRGRR